MRPQKAYLVEPSSETKVRGWKGRSKKINQIIHQIQEKYPSVVVLDSIFFPGTRIINVLCVHLPRKLSVKDIEKEFSCGLIGVTYSKSKPN